ncbi:MULTISPECIES: HpcH/HpaI aldolase/citrate lyase family protein [Salinibaculum]|uniref:HpcH/HpaI aldolase/citrate lyase family protein n=1 Tax=Salinibaculum TaxID=2732368 RepID=UPI0030D281A2
MARRSVLFSPGDQPDLIRKAPEAGADVVAIDLEDAVAPTAKAGARETVAATLPEIDPDCEVCVRVNAGDGAEADLAALEDAVEHFDSVMLPKAADADDVEALAERLADHGFDVPVLALVESARGVLNAARIADADPTDALLFGAEDLAADLGATRTDEGTEVLYARQRVVTAASAAGVDAIDTLWTDFEDEEGLRRDTERGIEMGYDGKMTIHPRQVGVVNDAFTPPPERIEWAERVLAAREEAAADGKGVFAVEGEMIDAPLLAQAERIVERASAAGRR